MEEEGEAEARRGGVQAGGQPQHPLHLEAEDPHDAAPAQGPQKGCRNDSRASNSSSSSLASSLTTKETIIAPVRREVSAVGTKKKFSIILGRKVMTPVERMASRTSTHTKNLKTTESQMAW